MYWSLIFGAVDVTSFPPGQNQLYLVRDELPWWMDWSSWRCFFFWKTVFHHELLAYAGVTSLVPVPVGYLMRLNFLAFASSRWDRVVLLCCALACCAFHFESIRRIKHSRCHALLFPGLVITGKKTSFFFPWPSCFYSVLNWPFEHNSYSPISVHNFWWMYNR